MADSKAVVVSGKGNGEVGASAIAAAMASAEATIDAMALDFSFDVPTVSKERASKGKAASKIIDGQTPTERRMRATWNPARHNWAPYDWGYDPQRTLKATTNAHPLVYILRYACTLATCATVQRTHAPHFLDCGIGEVAKYGIEENPNSPFPMFPDAVLSAMRLSDRRLPRKPAANITCGE